MTLKVSWFVHRRDWMRADLINRMIKEKRTRLIDGKTTDEQLNLLLSSSCRNTPPPQQLPPPTLKTRACTSGCSWLWSTLAVRALQCPPSVQHHKTLKWAFGYVPFWIFIPFNTPFTPSFTSQRKITSHLSAAGPIPDMCRLQSAL